MMRLYHYVGPKKFAERVGMLSAGTAVLFQQDVANWTRETGQELTAGAVTATFVIDASGGLLIADRRSEHVACAGALPARSAGEVTFAIGPRVEVTCVSNQSTGYCPEPESWPAVAEALSRAGFETREGFDLACVFRRCTERGSLNLVKEIVFECLICAAQLPAEYNVQPRTQINSLRSK